MSDHREQVLCEGEVHECLQVLFRQKLLVNMSLFRHVCKEYQLKALCVVPPEKPAPMYTPLQSSARPF